MNPLVLITSKLPYASVPLGLVENRPTSTSHFIVSVDPVCKTLIRQFVIHNNASNLTVSIGCKHPLSVRQESIVLPSGLQ
jgi:hypothetical protein